jgi:uncharacterized membrane protein
MNVQRIFWVFLAVVVLIVMFAPIAAYCMTNDNDDEVASTGTPILQPRALIASVPAPQIGPHVDSPRDGR